MRLTKYRLIDDGYGHLFLEYKKLVFWYAVPSPYYDLCDGRDLVIGNYDISGYKWYTSIKDAQFFIKMYPDIKEYLEKEYKPKQEELEKAVTSFWKRKKEKEGRLYKLN